MHNEGTHKRTLRSCNEDHSGQAQKVSVRIYGLPVFAGTRTWTQIYGFGVRFEGSLQPVTEEEGERESPHCRLE